MKKLILGMTILAFASGCEFNKNNNDTEVTTTTTTTQVVIEEPKEPEYIDDNPVKLGIYSFNENKSKRYLVNEYINVWKYHTDINTFNVFFTQDEEIDTTRVPVCFDKYSASYENVESYKIGFQIQFSVGEKEYNKTILRPNDPNEFFDYLEIYLYDGYHRAPGEWYSHTTEEQMNDKTLLTSIKLTAGVKNSEITSDIKLTAFSYNGEDDFDEDGFYRGDSKYSITVIRK